MYIVRGNRLREGSIEWEVVAELITNHLKQKQRIIIICIYISDCILVVRCIFISINGFEVFFVYIGVVLSIVIELETKK